MELRQVHSSFHLIRENLVILDEFIDLKKGRRSRTLKLYCSMCSSKSCHAQVSHRGLNSLAKVSWSFSNWKNRERLHATCATRTQDARELRSTCEITPARANHREPIETSCHLQYQTVPITAELTNHRPPARSRDRGVAASRLAAATLPPEFIYVLGVSD